MSNHQILSIKEGGHSHILQLNGSEIDTTVQNNIPCDATDTDDDDDDDSHDSLVLDDVSVSVLDAFHKCMAASGFTKPVQQKLTNSFLEGNIGFESSQEMCMFAKDFIANPQGLSNVLREDFGFNVLDAHRGRAILLDMVADNAAAHAANAIASPKEEEEDEIDIAVVDVAVSSPNGNGSGELQTPITHKENQATPLTNTNAFGVTTTNNVVVSPSTIMNRKAGEQLVNGIAIISDENKAFHSQSASLSASPFGAQTEEKEKRKVLYKNVVVNAKAKKRKDTTKGNNNNNHNHNIKDGNNNNNATATNNSNSYGLPKNCSVAHPQLQNELHQFGLYMTEPSARYKLQEDPIRHATADVYLRHARLFLGWYVNIYNSGSDAQQQQPTIRDNNIDADALIVPVARHNKEVDLDADADADTDTVTLFHIIPNKEHSSAQAIVDFVLWLRRTRDVSDSYEANILRGLTKLLKFRFALETSGSGNNSNNEATFSDIPAVRELRRLHRAANKRQNLSPRSSDEDKKWLSWDEYLKVVDCLKRDLLAEIEEHQSNISSMKQQQQQQQLCETQSESNNNNNGITTTIISPAQRRIATKFQYYLVLAFFSCIPDRQRTFRELELGNTFLRQSAPRADVSASGSNTGTGISDENAADDNANVNVGQWIIKHGPKDYKTGGTYGDRPALVLSPDLTPAIDTFIEQWRPCLMKQSDKHGHGHDNNDQDQHNFFFVQPRTGKPFSADSVYSIVGRCCYKFALKRTNPHLLRDMIVTHVRQMGNASEQELEALALYMGHSINMQRTSYDRRSMEQKVAPAVSLLRSLNNNRQQ
jgi:hypothetical protein